MMRMMIMMTIIKTVRIVPNNKTDIIIHDNDKCIYMLDVAIQETEMWSRKKQRRF
jgi:hypothetical protein